MGVMVMSEQERLRKAIFEMVKQKRLTLKQAAIQCELSYRQVLRIYRRYITQGDAGLTHQSRGQRSNRKHPHREEIITLYQTKYEGFGPTVYFGLSRTPISETIEHPKRFCPNTHYGFTRTVISVLPEHSKRFSRTPITV